MFHNFEYIVTETRNRKEMGKRLMRSTSSLLATGVTSGMDPPDVIIVCSLTMATQFLHFCLKTIQFRIQSAFSLFPPPFALF